MLLVGILSVANPLGAFLLDINEVVAGVWSLIWMSFAAAAFGSRVIRHWSKDVYVLSGIIGGKSRAPDESSILTMFGGAEWDVVEFSPPVSTYQLFRDGTLSGLCGEGNERLWGEVFCRKRLIKILVELDPAVLLCRPGLKAVNRLSRLLDRGADRPVRDSSPAADDGTQREI